MITKLNKVKQIILLSLVAICLQIYDFITTTLVINKGGSELNPIINFLIGIVGITKGLIISKIFCTLLILFLLAVITFNKKCNSSLIKNGLIIIITVYIVILGNVTLQLAEISIF